MTDDRKPLVDPVLGPPKPEDVEAAIPIDLVTSAVSAPTTFVDGCLFATRVGGTVRLTFVETIFEAQDSPYPGMKSRHVVTLVMPQEGFQATIGYLEGRKDYLLEGLSDAE